MPATQWDVGIVGLGVMGRNLGLNFVDHGFRVVGLDRDASRASIFQNDAVQNDAETDRALGVTTPRELTASLQRPRAILILVPAGETVDQVIRGLLPHLDPDDIILDCGNSHFADTDVRTKALAERHVRYLGVGVSGGEAGARHGPSLMPGGSKDGFERVRNMLEAAAARVDGEPCIAYLGPGSAGHYVKMVHNGIEYGVMQLIAETYDLMKRGLGKSDSELHEIYRRWNEQESPSFLLEITARVFDQRDDRTGAPLIDVILDEAKQKGTGMWTSEEAMNLQVPTPTIDVAVLMRHMSACKDEREIAADALGDPPRRLEHDQSSLEDRLQRAYSAATTVVFAQGMALLGRASARHEYGLDLESIARIWRGGCIIRTKLLEDIRAAFQRHPELPNLLLDRELGSRVRERQDDLRAIVAAGVSSGVPVPALSASLSYFDSYRSAWLPANLIQAQRDLFGSHSYERVDRKGSFHTHWR